MSAHVVAAAVVSLPLDGDHRMDCPQDLVAALLHCTCEKYHIIKNWPVDERDSERKHTASRHYTNIHIKKIISGNAKLLVTNESHAIGFTSIP